MSSRRINPRVDTFRGINNALNPCSPQYRQGFAYEALNSRLNESGLWDKSAALSAVSLGDSLAKGLPITLDCLAYWKMEESAANTTVADSYGSHTGVASANTSTMTATGKLGNCFNLAGTKYVTVADSDDFTFVDTTSDLPFSIGMWVYMPATFLATKTLISKYDATTGNEKREWILEIIGGNKVPALRLYDETENAFIYCNVGTISLSTGWHFVAFTYDGSALHTGFTLYVDGIEKTYSHTAEGVYVKQRNTTAPVIIGAHENEGGAIAGIYTDKIDSVMVFNKELSANEVYQLYNNGSGLADIDEALCPHYKGVTIKDSNYIAKYLKYNTCLSVGPNKYGYFVSDDMGSSRKVYWWDGTDKASAAGYVNNATAFNYGLAGMGRPTASHYIEFNTFGVESEYGGRMERGRYYYMYTWWDDARKCESLPSTVKEYTSTVWNSYYESTYYPIISVLPETQATAPTSGSPRYDTDTKVRVYRSKRSYSDKNVINPPNIFFYIGDMDYKAGLTGLIYDHTGGTVARMLSGSNGNFTGVAAGDLLYLYDSAGANIPDKAYKVSAIDATNAAYVQLTDDGDLSGDDTTIKCSFMCLIDSLHDNEIQDEYEGRGSAPPSDVDYMVPFSNRMYYFAGNTAYWSSAAQPEEVAKEYTLTFSVLVAAGVTKTSTVDCMPKLSTGSYGESKYEISELAGETIIAAYSFLNRLYVWTQEGTCGYLEGTYLTEGVRFNLLRKGIGIISDKTLIHSPYGLFGADREGVWQMDNRGSIYRISKGSIDIGTSTKSTYAKQASLEHSFGVWSPAMEEYVWCLINLGETTICRQIAYNPMRNIFNGIYGYPALFGGCTIATTAGMQNYLTNAKTFDITSHEALAQEFQFWMGQDSLESVKDTLEVEIIYESITALKTVTVDVYQNNIASTAGAYSLTGISHTSANLVGKIDSKGSGRVFLVKITIPADCVAPIIALNYIANYVVWGEKCLR